MMNEYVDITIKVIVTVFLCGAIGYQRETENKPAGLRTNIIVGLGAALAMLVSKEFDADASRIASSVLAGIGFLGGGVFIAMKQSNGDGLTTAATLWTVAVIGLAVGMGYYFGAVLVSIVTLILLTLNRDKKPNNSNISV